MAIFYVFPSRQVLGDRLADHLAAIFPGIRYPHSDCPDLAESLAKLVEDQSEAYVVYGEDLDEERSIKDSLMLNFGADPSDEIIEIQFGTELHQILHLRWSTEGNRKAA